MVSVATEAEKIVEEFTQNGDMFSAFDVTRSLRNAFTNENIRHSDVKAKVNQIFTNDDMGIYHREQVDIGTRVNPFIYHLPHEDAEDYNPRWLDSQLGIASPVTATPVIATIQTPSTNSSTITPQQVQQSMQAVSQADRVLSLTTGFSKLKTTQEGRLNLPASILKNFSGKVYVSLSTVRKDNQNVDALTISDQNVAPNALIRTYNVNSDGRLRISARYLNKAGKSDNYAVKYIKPTNGHDTIVVVPEA
jgi:hypothetical protein